MAGHLRQAPAHQREQVAGLRPGVMPDGIVPVGALDRPAAHKVAVAEQDGRLVPVRLDAGGVDREHVGAVRKIGDAPEAFGLALRAIGAVAAIEPHELGVGGGLQQGFHLKGEGIARGRRQDQAGRGGLVGAAGEGGAINRHAHERQPVAIQPQRRSRFPGRVAPYLELCYRARRCRMKRDVQMDRIHQPVRRTVVRQVDRGGIGITHHRLRAHGGSVATTLGP